MKSESNDAQREKTEGGLFDGVYGVLDIIGNGTAYVSLACCASFWMLFALHFLGFDPLPRLTGFVVFKTMAFSVVLAIVSLVLRSRLWKFALPIALAMFFFTMYVMGT